MMEAPAFEWYPGYRPEESLTRAQIRLLQKILTTTPSSEMEELAKMIRPLYIAATSACVVADHYYGETTKYHTHHKTVMEQVVKQAIEVKNMINSQDLQRRETALVITRYQREVDLQRKDLEKLTREKDAFFNVVKQMREVLICPICCEVALLPKVLGTCGHIACQHCLIQLDAVAFDTLTQAAAAGGASGRQHLLARRCPLCRAEIIGQAFPVLALKHIVCLLVENELIEVSELTVQKSLVGNKKLTFEEETQETKHMSALQINCWAQSQLSQHSVAMVISRVPPVQWLVGVYILFEAAVSRVFFETFSTTLHGKAGGINVLVNTSQRMLAVQLIERRPGRSAALDTKGDDSTAIVTPFSSSTTIPDKPPPPPPPIDDNGATNFSSTPVPGPRQHLLIKVSTDGRFVITVTPPSPEPVIPVEPPPPPPAPQP